MANKIKVLLVDDEEDFRQIMTFWLKSKGYSVIEASNGKEAIKLVKEKDPNMILLDLYMPIMNGIDALKAIREFNKDVPVIILTAHAEDRRTPEARAHGISGLFCKGRDFTGGLSLLESALRTHKKLKNIGKD